MWNLPKPTLSLVCFMVPDRKVFGLNTNQYLGNFPFPLRDRQSPLRPFLFFGLGATNLSPDRRVDSITCFAWALGASQYNSASTLNAYPVKWAPTTHDRRRLRWTHFGVDVLL